MHGVQQGVDDRNVGGVEGEFRAIPLEQLGLKEGQKRHVEQQRNTILLEEELRVVTIRRAHHGVHFARLVLGNGLLCNERREKRKPPSAAPAWTAS